MKKITINMNKEQYYALRELGALFGVNDDEQIIKIILADTYRAYSPDVGRTRPYMNRI